MLHGGILSVACCALYFRFKVKIEKRERKRLLQTLRFLHVNVVIHITMVHPVDKAISVLQHPVPCKLATVLDRDVAKQRDVTRCQQADVIPFVVLVLLPARQ